MQCALSLVTEPVALASEITGVTPMLSVSPSVWSMPSVPATWLVSTSIVLTRARGFVAITLLAMSTTTLPTVGVTQVTPEMLSLAVPGLPHVRLLGIIIQKDGIY